MKKVIFLINSSLLYSIPTALAITSAIVLLPIYTRYLQPEDYGILAVLAVLSGLGLSFSSWNTDASIYRFSNHFETKQEKKEFLGTIYIFKFTLSLVIASLIVCLGATLYHFGYGYEDVPFTPFIVTQAIIIFLSTCTGFQLILWISEEKPKANAYVQVISFFLINLSALIFIIFFNEGAWGKIKALLVTESILFFIFTYLSLKKISLTFSLNYLKKSFRFCLPLFFSQLANLLLKYSDRIILAFYLDISKIGFLHVADSLSRSLESVWRGAEKAVMPYVFNSTEDEETVNKTLSALYELWVMVACIILISFALTVKPFIFNILGESYRDQEVYIASLLLALAYFFSIVYPFFTLALAIAEKTNLILQVTLTVTILNISLNIILIPLYGWLAAPFTTAFSSFVLAFLFWLQAKRATSIRLNFLFILYCFSMSIGIFLLTESLIPNTSLIYELIKIPFGALLLIIIFYFVFDIKKRVLQIN